MTDTPERILLIRPSALGDVCRTVPVLRSLRAAYPRAQIDWLVRSDWQEAIVAHPDLDGVVPFHRDRLRSIRVRVLRHRLRRARSRVKEVSSGCQLSQAPGDDTP